MPDSGDDALEARVRRLEDEVVRLKRDVAASHQDAAAARVLAVGADRDVSEMRSELRAHTQTLGALRETQIEHGAALTALRSELTGLRGDMEQGFGAVHTGIAQITALIRSIEQRDAD